MKRLALALLLLAAPALSHDRWPDAGGGGGGVTAPGLLGSSMTDTTLEWAASLTHAAFMPQLPRLYYSSGTTDVVAGCSAVLGPAGLGGYPTGNDNTGDGSKAAPYRSLGRILSDTQQGGVIAVMDACDSWTDGTPDAGGISDLECAAGASCTQTYLMDRTAGAPPRFAWGGTAIGATKCTDPDGLCFALIGSDPSGAYRPKIDLATITGAEASNHWFIFSMPSTMGWAHFENLRIGDATVGLPNDTTGDCGTAEGDLFRTETGASNSSRTSAINIESYHCSDESKNNEFWTSHHADAANPNVLDFFWSINNQIYYPDYGGVVDQTFEAYFNIGQSALGIIGGFMRSQVTSTAAADTDCVIMTSSNGSNYGFVYNSDCVYENNTAPLAPHGFSCASGLSTTDCRIFVARSRVLNAGGAANGGFFSNPGTTPKNVVYSGYRNSSIGNDAYLSLSASIATGNQLRVVDRCSLHWKGTPAGTDNALISHTGGNCAGIDVDFVQTGVVESDTSVAVVESTTAATLAALDAVVATRGCHDGAPFTSFSATAIPLSANPFSTGGASGVAATTAVDNACTVGAITEPFLHDFYGPAHIFGKKVTGAVLNPSGDATALGR